MFFGVNSFPPSSWDQHFRVIFTGCTISIILLLSAINVAIKFILAETNILQYFKTLTVTIFMHDLSLKSKNVDELHIVLELNSFVLK